MFLAPLYQHTITPGGAGPAPPNRPQPILKMPSAIPGEIEEFGAGSMYSLAQFKAVPYIQHGGPVMLHHAYEPDYDGKMWITLPSAPRINPTNRQVLVMMQQTADALEIPDYMGKWWMITPLAPKIRSNQRQLMFLQSPELIDVPGGVN